VGEPRRNPDGKEAADEARDREIRELKQLIECLHEQTKANTEMVGQPIEATKDNARNARKAREAAEGTQEAVNAIRGRISNIEQILTEPEPEPTETLSQTFRARGERYERPS